MYYLNSLTYNLGSMLHKKNWKKSKIWPRLDKMEYKKKCEIKLKLDSNWKKNRKGKKVPIEKGNKGRIKVQMDYGKKVPKWLDKKSQF